MSRQGTTRDQWDDNQWWSGRAFRLVAWIAIAIPPIFFYVLLSKSLTSLPFLDDYGAVLSFLLKWNQEHGLQHLVQIVTAQHNEYRLMFESAIFGAQYSVLGHADLKALAVLGDLLVVPILGVLYLIWREDGYSREAILLFVPASWLLFQLQYASTLNCAMAPLQNLAVILFALLSCYLAAKPGALAFAASICSLILSIASSGNGLFMIPIGCIMFLQRREYPRLAIWFAVSAVMCFLYFHGYSLHAAQTHTDHNVLSSFKHLSPAYGAAFLGSIAATTNPVPAILLSIVLLAVFIAATRDRLFESNPALYYSMLFFFVTGLAVSGLRSDAGLITALGSRYRINSVVIVILTYFYLIDKFRHSISRWKQPTAITVVSLAGLVLIGFNLASDRAGNKLLLTRRHKLEAAMLRWERNEPPPPFVGADPSDYTAKNEKMGYFEPVEPTLSDSIREGIYRLPQLPE